MCPYKSKKDSRGMNEMVSTVKAEASSTKHQATGETNNVELVSFFVTVFQSDIRFKIVATLSNREGAGLREIARQVGISHKNLGKYLQTLQENGILEAYSIGVRSKVYRLSSKYDFVRQFLKN